MAGEQAAAAVAAGPVCAVARQSRSLHDPSLPLRANLHEDVCIRNTTRAWEYAHPTPTRSTLGRSAAPCVAPRHAHAARQERLWHVYVARRIGGVGLACCGCGPRAMRWRARDRDHCRYEHRARLSTCMFACVCRCGQRRAVAVAPRRRAAQGCWRPSLRVRQQRGQVCAAKTQATLGSGTAPPSKRGDADGDDK